jgi:hypothetical protein
MEEELTPSDEGEVCPVSPTYRAGDTIVFKYAGNVRATVEGCELVDGRVWLRYGARSTGNITEEFVKKYLEHHCHLYSEQGNGRFYSGVGLSVLDVSSCTDSA